MSSIEVNTLPVVQELFEDDFIIVQSKNRTALIKFEDFVIGEQQVSFYKEIVDARNSITSIIERLDTVDQSISELQDKLTESEQTTQEITTSLTQISDDVNNIKQQVADIDSRLDVESLKAQSIANDVQEMQENSSQTPVAQHASRISKLETGSENINNLLGKLQTDLQSTLTSINGLNTQIYIHGQRISDIEG